MLKMVIRMNDDKITAENKYRLDGIYNTINHTFQTVGLPRMEDGSGALVFRDCGRARDFSLFGRIVNICSTRYLMSEPGSEGYAASKGGIYSLTHALALSLAEWHITVNSISPGWICTGDYEQLRPEDHAQHPSGRVGKPEDIARMCLFICQEENDFMNGENVTIDGGMTKKMIYIE